MDIKQDGESREIHIPAKPRESMEDRKLLDRPTRHETLQSDSWRVLRITIEFVAGFDNLADAYPAVSILGSRRSREEDPFYHEAVQTAELQCTAAYAILIV